MGRWLQLDDKIINLDQVTLIAPRRRGSGSKQDVEHPEYPGANISLINGDGVYTSKSVEEVFRLIECAEGPEPPRALITDHDFDGILGGVYQCAICFRPKGEHAK